MSIVDPIGPRRLEELTHWAERGMGGTRVFHIPPPDPPWLDDRATEPFWLRCAELGIRTNVCLLRRDLAALGRLLTWAPHRPISLDHCGLIELPDAKPDAGSLAELTALAGFDNLYLKVSPNVFAFAQAIDMPAAQLVRAAGRCLRRRAAHVELGLAQRQRPPLSPARGSGRHATELLSKDEADMVMGGTACSVWPELAP